MAELSKLDFQGKYNNVLTGLFKNNTTRDITPERVRTLVTDVSDTFSVNHARGSYDLSTEAYPSSGGTGSGGIPAVNDWWYGINSGDFDVEDLGTITLNRGALLIYIGGTVSDASSWIVKQ